MIRVVHSRAGWESGSHQITLDSCVASDLVTAWKRYLLFQLPSWALVSLLVYLLAQWAILSRTVAVLLVAAYVLKDLLLYRFLRRAYLPPPPSVVEHMVGHVGVTKQDLNPEG